MSKLVKGEEAPSTTTDGDAHAALTVPSDKLTSDERATFEKLEEEIDDALFSFVDIGLPLGVIRDQRLYRQHNANFDEYCLDRWGFSRQRASQLIKAARLAEHLSTLVYSEPTNEYQVRPLIGLPSEDAVKAWKLAEKLSGSQPITGRLVEKAIETIRGDGGITAKSGSDASTTGVEQARDEVGHVALDTDAAIPPEQTAAEKTISAPTTDIHPPTAKVSEDTGSNTKNGEEIMAIEAEPIEQPADESFELADGTHSAPMPFSASGDGITAEAVAGKLRQMAENNSNAGDAHRKEGSVIAGRQTALLELVATANRVGSSPDTRCEPEQIYWAADELLHLLAHRRPVTANESE